MSQSVQNLPLEQMITGLFGFLVVLLLVVFGLALVSLAKLARGPGRSPYRAKVSDLALPAAPLAPASPPVPVPPPCAPSVLPPS